MKRIFLFLSLFSLHDRNLAQTWADTTAQIEKIFSRYIPANPGAELAIMRNGKIIFSKAWGMADLEHPTPLTTESLSEAGSVSKQFTAASILLLEQQGKLSVNDDIRKYLPELPRYDHPILIRHMLEHTSGLKDWGSIAELGGWPRSTRTYSNEDALLIQSRQKTLNNIPGEEYIYSNSNYNLLAMVVQRVSGMSLAEFSKKYIFEPSGMSNTQWRDDFKRIVPRRATAYSWVNGQYKTNMPNEYVYGQGGLLTTAEDLVTWNNFYGSGKLGNPPLLEKQIHSYPFNNGRPHHYAAGLAIGEFKGWKQIGHSGATASYRANLEYYPELGLSIAWLSNTSQYDRSTYNVSRAVADLMIKQKGEEQKKEEEKAFAISAQSIKNFAGWYKNGRSGEPLSLIVKEGKLIALPSDTLLPLGDHAFTDGDTRFELVNGKTSFLRLIDAAMDSVDYFPVAEGSKDSSSSKQYLGEYYSTEADTRYSILMKDGKLNLFRQPESWYILSPTYKDGFEFDFGILYFVRNGKALITGFNASVDRARNIQFTRVK